MNDVERCGWCRKEPTKDYFGALGECVSCSTPKCLLKGYGYKPESWNAAQLRILEARRRDFDAGLSCKYVYDEQGNPQNKTVAELAFDDYLRESEKD